MQSTSVITTLCSMSTTQHLATGCFAKTIQVNGRYAVVQDDKIKITLTAIADLRDFQLHSGLIVLNGKGFVITKPSVLHFHIFNYDLLFSLEDVQTVTDSHLLTKEFEDYQEFVTDMARQPHLCMETIFIEFPDDICVRANMTEEYPHPPQRDTPVDLCLRELPTLCEVPGEDNKPVEKAQMFHPAHWNLRVVREGEARALAFNNQERANDVCSAMQGMKKAKGNPKIYQI
jgi:hypothetical protein